MVKQLLGSTSSSIIATCRDPSKASALKSLSDGAPGLVHIVPMDTSNFESIRSAAKQVTDIIGTKGIDYLINNAGIVSSRLTCRCIEHKADSIHVVFHRHRVPDGHG